MNFSVKFSVKNKWIIIAVIFISLIIVIPPFQSPDEFAHFSRSFQIASGEITINERNEKDQPVSFIPNQILDFFNTVGNLPYMPDSIFKYTVVLEMIDDKIDYNEGQQYYSTASNYTVTNYIGSTFSILIGKLLNSSPVIMYYASRILNLLIAFIFIWLAIIFLPTFKYLILSVVFLPMTFFQIVSTSADAFVIPYTIFFTSYVIYLFLKKDQISYKEKLLLIFLTVILVYTKTILAPLTLLTLLIIFQEKGFFAKIVHFFILTIIPNIIGALSFIYFSYLPSLSGKTHELILEYSYLVEFRIFVSKMILDMYNNTNFYFETYIGKLGWLDTTLNYLIIIIPAFLLLLLSSINVYQQVKVQLSDKSVRQIVIVFLSIILSYTFLLYLSLYLFWWKTGHGAFGIQGRYFIPITIPMFFIIAIILSKIIKIKESFTKYYYYFVLWIVILTLFTLIERYY